MRILMFFILLLCASITCSEAKDATKPSRQILQQENLSTSNQQIKMIRVIYPPGYKEKSHKHVEPGLGYVVNGCLKSGFGKESPIIYKTGESFVERADKIHSHIENCDSKDPLEMIITFSLGENQKALIPIE